MSSKITEDKIECSCTRYCVYQLMDSQWIQNRCLRADCVFERLEHVIKLQADLNKGVELIMPDGTPLKDGGIDFFEYRVAAIMSAYDFILDIEKCQNARKIIKDTNYEKIYFEAKEKYSAAIEKLLKISDEDILRLENDPHHEIDL